MTFLGSHMPLTNTFGVEPVTSPRAKRFGVDAGLLATTALCLVLAATAPALADGGSGGGAERGFGGLDNVSGGLGASGASGTNFIGGGGGGGVGNRFSVNVPTLTLSSSGVANAGGNGGSGNGNGGGGGDLPGHIAGLPRGLDRHADRVACEAQRGRLR